MQFYGDETEFEQRVFDDYLWFRLMTQNCLFQRQNYLLYHSVIYNLPGKQPRHGLFEYDARFWIMRDYARGVLGYPAAVAPDAWCALREM